VYRKIIACSLALLLFAALITPSSVAASNALDGKVIILDPGHGAGTTNVFAGYDEQARMLVLAQKIKPLLEERGATVYMTRATSENVPLSVRAANINIMALEVVRSSRELELGENPGAAGDIDEINRLIGVMQSIIDDPDKNSSIYMNTPFAPGRRAHADMRRIFEFQDHPEIASRFLVISLHSNATNPPINTSLNGANAFHISNAHRNTRNYYTGYSHIDQSYHFGDILLDHISEAGIRRRSVLRENYFIIREHNLPAVLVENGFHTNPGNRASLQSDSFLDRLALAYLDAITDYYLAISPPPPDRALPFSDVQYDAWYFDAVKYATEHGLLVGTAPGRFSPDIGMTRAMLATLLARLLSADFSALTDAPYADVSIDAWYGRPVAWAASNGIVSYIEGNIFSPGQNAAREEMAMMVYNFLQWNNLEADVSIEIFADDADISPWARAAVYALRDYGVIRGDDMNRFNPQDTITRAEVSQIIYNLHMAGQEDS